MLTSSPESMVSLGGSLGSSQPHCTVSFEALSRWTFCACAGAASKRDSATISNRMVPPPPGSRAPYQLAKKLLDRRAAKQDGPMVLPSYHPTIVHALLCQKDPRAPGHGRAARGAQGEAVRTGGGADKAADRQGS